MTSRTELAFPVRVYWDAEFSDERRDLNRRICQELLASKILALHVTVETPGSGHDLLGRLTRSLSLSVTIPVAAVLESGSFVLDCGAKNVYFGVSSIDEARASLELIRFFRSQLTMDVRFGLSLSSIYRVPGSMIEYLLYSREQGIVDLIVPIQRICRGEECRFPEPGDAGTLDPSSLRMIIHDPFLWKALFPSRTLPVNGCDAGNSMVFITSDGAVYPCPALDMTLGTLQDRSFRDLVDSPVKTDVRRILSRSPSDCRGCPECPRCLGGCRGRALALTGALDKRDPACDYSPMR